MFKQSIRRFGLLAVALPLLAASNIGSANAGTRCSTTSTGYDICTTDRGDYGSDSIGIWNPAGQHVAQMRVICTGNGGNRWSAQSVESKSTMQSLANWWCRNY